MRMKKGNVAALLPIGVFLCIYLGLGILFEYVMKIPMGFYNVPIIIAFLAAILAACLQNRKVSFDDKLEIMAQGLADKNIITMLLIFLTAGSFVGVVGRDILGCGIICCGMLCVSGNGHFCRDDHIDHTDRCCGIEGIGI